MTDTICLPRAVVEALVDPTNHGVFDMETGECNFCSATYQKPNHAPACPVRLVQEALKAEPDTWFHATLTALAQEMRIIGNDRVAEYGWRLTRLLEEDASPTSPPPPPRR